MKDVLRSMNALQSKIGEEIEKRDKIYSDSDDLWRESDNAAEHNEFTQRLQSMQADVTEWIEEVSSKI